MQVREWYPPSRPKIRELGDLLKKGWVFTGGYVEDGKRLVFGHEAMSEVIERHLREGKSLILPMVAFQMQKP